MYVQIQQVIEISLGQKGQNRGQKVVAHVLCILSLIKIIHFTFNLNSCVKVYFFLITYTYHILFNLFSPKIAGHILFYSILFYFKSFYSSTTINVQGSLAIHVACQPVSITKQESVRQRNLNKCIKIAYGKAKLGLAVIDLAVNVLRVKQDK